MVYGYFWVESAYEKVYDPTLLNLVEFLRPWDPSSLHKGDQPGKIVRIGENDPFLQQNGLDALFGGLLRVKA